MLLKGPEPGVPAAVPDHPGGESQPHPPRHPGQVHQPHAQDPRGQLSAPQVKKIGTLLFSKAGQRD
jgi:hypothetical protein